jgi:hypothetical protein
MSPLRTTLLTFLLGCFGVTFPFLLGRFSKGTRCRDCDTRQAANRARRNGELVAEHRARMARACSPDEVIAQAAADRATLARLVTLPLPRAHAAGHAGHLDRSEITEDHRTAGWHHLGITGLSAEIRHELKRQARAFGFQA